MSGSSHEYNKTRNLAGVRECVRCRIVGEHGAGQTFCKACHREIVKLRTASLPAVRECYRCGEIEEHSPGNSRCKKCKNAYAKEATKVRKAAKKGFLPN